MQEWMSIREIAAEMKLTPSRVRQLLYEYGIAFREVSSRCILVSRKEVQRLKRMRTKK